jgi:hypothetical protein
VAWLSLTVVGFTALTALVVMLGRGSTARWEAERTPLPPVAPRR